MAQARWRRHNGADQAGLGTVARQQEPGGVRNDVDPEREQPQPCPTRRAALDPKGADPSSARSRHHNSAPLVTSMTDAIPNPVRATEPAARRAAIATIPSRAL